MFLIQIVAAILYRIAAGDGSLITGKNPTHMARDFLSVLLQFQHLAQVLMRVPCIYELWVGGSSYCIASTTDGRGLMEYQLIGDQLSRRGARLSLRGFFCPYPYLYR